MTGRALVAPVALLLVGPALAAAQDLPSSEHYILRAEYTRWSADLTGKIQKGFGTEEGTLLDLDSDLGVTGKETWQGKGTIRLGSKFKLRGAYVPVQYRGDVIAQTNFVYGGKQYFAGSRVQTSIDGQYYSGDFQWDFRRGSGGFFGAFVGARVFDVSSILVDDTGQRVVQDKTVPIPVLGIGGRTYYGRRFSVEGSLAGMTAGSRGHIWEVDLYARINFSDRLAVGGGYHHVTLQGTDKDKRDSVDLRMGGWQYGVELSL
jgi:hypothetical protein